MYEGLSPPEDVQYISQTSQFNQHHTLTSHLHTTSDHHITTYRMFRMSSPQPNTSTSPTSLAARCSASLSRRSRLRTSSPSHLQSLSHPTRPWETAPSHVRDSSRSPSISSCLVSRRDRMSRLRLRGTQTKSIESNNQKPINHCCSTRRRSTGTTQATRDECRSRAPPGRLL